MLCRAEIHVKPLAVPRGRMNSKGRLQTDAMIAFRHNLSWPELHLTTVVAIWVCAEGRPGPSRMSLPWTKKLFPSEALQPYKG